MGQGLKKPGILIAHPVIGAHVYNKRESPADGARVPVALGDKTHQTNGVCNPQTSAEVPRHFPCQTGINGVILETISPLLEELEKLTVVNRACSGGGRRIPAVDLNGPVVKAIAQLGAGFISAAGIG